MEEQTKAQASPQGMEDPIARAVNILAQSEDDQAPPQQGQQTEPPVAESTEQPEGQAAEELTPDDLEVEQQPNEQPDAVDAFEIEIVHNDKQVKLSREDAIKYAMQGFDYTQKTQALAAEKRQVDAYLQTLAQVDEVRPYLQQYEGQLRAVEAQMAPYMGIDWVREATEDPLGYPAKHAQYQLLQQQYAQASQQYQRARGYVSNQLQQVEAHRRAVETQRLPEFIPQWKDNAKRQADEVAIVKHYAETYGVSEQELRGSLKGALSVAVIYKAMKYDQLQKAKGEKVKQLRTAPPVTVPGAKTGSPKGDQEKQLRGKLRKTGSIDDAAALLLNRMS